MELTAFNNAEFGTIRACEINGEPYFVGNDIAKALGYSNPRDAISRHVDAEDKGVVKRDTLGGSQDMTVINESGLYCLILSSHMPGAKKFRRWVTSEVLPSIRKHGLYAVQDLIDNPDLAIRILMSLKEEREKRKELELTAAIQKQQIAEMQPKASYYDLILQNRGTVPVTQIAKDYGISGRKFNALLHDLGIQYKMRNTWLLYQQYAECGYTQSRTYALESGRNAMHTCWTQKGRLFLYGLLKNNGILPMIELGEEGPYVQEQ